jgi:rubredoxin
MGSELVDPSLRIVPDHDFRDISAKWNCPERAIHLGANWAKIEVGRIGRVCEEKLNTFELIPVATQFNLSDSHATLVAG